MFTDNENLKKSSGYISLDDILKLAIDIADKIVGYELVSVKPKKKQKKKKRKKQEPVQ